jgi:homoserine dehydrogenase
MTIDLLLVGFGHVGRRFARLLDERRERLAADDDLRPRIVGIATGRHGAALDPAGLDVPRALALVEAGASIAPLHQSRHLPPPATGLDLIAAAAAGPDAERPRVVIEATPLNIDDGRPAIDHIRLALLSRMHVASANKGPVALAHRELDALAKRLEAQYRFEGAVMDGVPIFNLVRHTLPAIEISGFRGVVNSTTNYIISMLEDGGEFDSALAEMQRQGIAEADPSLDVDGWDAAAKAAALVNVLMDGAIAPRDVAREGIGHLTGAAVREAAARGRRKRLVASATRDSQGVRVRVAVEELPADDPLAQLRGMSNALFLQTDLLGRVGITQLDGGLTQTAYALLSDLVAIRRALRGTR